MSRLTFVSLVHLRSASRLAAVSLSRRLAVPVAAAIVLAASPGNAAEPPTQAELAAACHRTIARAGVLTVGTHLKSAQTCLHAWDKCAAGGDTQRCRDRAARTCARERARRDRHRTRRARAITDGCSPVASAMLLERDGLGYRLLGDACREHYDTAIDGPAGIATCLAAQHECYAHALLHALRPSTAASLLSVAPDLGPDACPARFDADETGGAAFGTPLDTRCTRRLERLGIETLVKRLKGLQRCTTKLLHCDLAGSPDPDCPARALASCRLRLGRLAGRAARKRTALVTRCGAPRTGDAPLGCDGAIWATTDNLGDAAACLAHDAQCWAAELLQFETPRGYGLLDTADASLVGEDCAPETLPTDLPPPDNAELSLGGIGATATTTPTATPDGASDTGAAPTATPTVAAVATPTPMPTPTATATPAPTATASPPCIGVALAIDPKNPDVLYASLRGRGLFKSTTGGRAPWFLLGLQNIVVNELVINPKLPSTLFAATEGQGVLRSTSSGTRFQPTGLFAIRDADRVRALVLDPAEPNIIYAGTHGAGIVRSTSNGNAWEVTSLFSFPGGTFVRALAVSAGASGTLAAGVADGGVYRSTTRGRSFSFTSLATLPGGRSVLALAIDAATGDTIYAATESGDLFQSTDGGNAWFATNFRAFGRGRPRAVAIDPQHPTVVYASRDGDIDKSQDGGRTWQTTGFKAQAGATVVCELVVAPAGQTLFAASDDGRIFTSSNAGATWRDASTGLP